MMDSKFFLHVCVITLFLTGQGVAGETGVAAGALYPADVVAPIEVAPTAKPAQQESSARASSASLAIETRVADPALSKALGPAGYILAAAAGRNDFEAQIRRAVGRHPAFHAQLSTLDEGAAGSKRARSSLYPQLSTQLRGDYVISREFGANTDNVVESLRPKEQFTAGLSASQLVFDGGATFQRIKSARARQSEFENSISVRINDLAYEALTVYHDMLTHQALVALGDAIVQQHEDILADVKERERLGAGSMADVTRATARLAATRARVSEIKESAQLAEIRYREFFGEDPGVLARPALDGVMVDSQDEAVAAAMRRSPDMAVAAAQAKASTADYKATKGERLPEVRVSVDALKYDVFSGGDDYDVRAGVNLNYDIFNGGRRSANIAEAGSKARQAKFKEEQVRQEIAREAAFAYERSAGAGDRLDALAAAVVAQDTTRALVRERYRVARGDLIDVLQAENDYFESAVAYITGLANRDLAAYALMEHTGDLLRLFSPENEYADVLNEGVDG